MASKYQHALPVDGRIENYVIKEVLGEGGFGITYRARDEELQADVAIKEYLPAEIAARASDHSTVVPKSDSAGDDYEYGLERFLDEARTLARFKEPNIVRVSRFFRANGTGYIVMEYEKGQTFSEYLKKNKKPSEDELVSLFVPILDGLRAVHAQNYLHRDIKPGNIYIRSNGTPMLIDFGASRQALSEHSRSMTGIVTAGYAPFEQYGQRAKHQPCTDLYAIGATLYRAISGHAPADSPERIDAMHCEEPDPMKPAVEVGRNRYSENFLRVIDWLLEPIAKNRPQSVDEVINVLVGNQSAPDEPATAIIQGGNDEPPTAVTRVMKPARKGGSGKGALIGVVLAVVAAVIGVAVWMLLPRYGSLNINSIPQSAEWYLDGRKIGSTPGQIKELKPGAHIIEVKAKGYKPWRQSVLVKKDQTASIQAKLIQELYRLRINTTPSNARIRLLDSFDRYRPGMKLKPGNYRVEVSYSGYQTETRDFTISNEDKALDVRLQKQRYALNVRTYPSNASIRMVSPNLEYKSGMKLESGVYTFEVSANGYQTRRVQVRVRNRSTSPYIRLARVVPQVSTNDLYRRGQLAFNNRDYPTALNWFTKAASKGHPEAMYQIGRMYRFGYGVGTNKSLALRWFKVGAARGSVKAAAAAGFLYFKGIGASRDYNQAMRYYRIAAAKNHGSAFNQIGWFYQNGLGVSKNYYEAVRYYRRGARAGNRASMNNLGYMYYKGYGVSKNNYTAFRYFRQSANAGSVVAMDWVGTFYEQGIGTSKNMSQAIYWYRRAARRGNKSASKSLLRLTGSSR